MVHDYEEGVVLITDNYEEALDTLNLQRIGCKKMDVNLMEKKE